MGLLERKTKYLALHLLLLHPHGHFPIIKHSLERVLDIGSFLRDLLANDINLMLREASFSPMPLNLDLSAVLDLGPQLTTSSAEEI